MPLLPLYAFTDLIGTTLLPVIGYLTTFFEVNNSMAWKRPESFKGKDM